MAESRLQVITATDLLSQPEPSVNWLVEGLLPQGTFGFIGGPPKSFKTVSELKLAVCVATGTDLLGMRVRRKGPVLIVHQEDRDAYIRQQLGKIVAAMGLGERMERGEEIRPLAADDDMVTELPLHAGIWTPASPLLENIHLVLNQGVDLLNEDDWREIDEIMGEIEPLLTIIDTTISVLPGVKAKEYGPMSQAIDLPRRLCRRHGCTMLCVHHSNKAAAGSGGENLMDSNAFHAASEASIYSHKAHGGKKLPRNRVRWEREIKGGGGGLPDVVIEVTENSRGISYSLVEDSRSDEGDDHTAAEGKKPPFDEEAIRIILRAVPGRCLTQNKLMALLRKAYRVDAQRLPQVLRAMPDMTKTARGWELR